MMFISLLSFLVAALIFCAGNVRAQGNTGAIVWKGVQEIAAGKGDKGPWRQNDSHYDYVDDPAVAIDEQGTIAIAWVDQKRKDVLFRHIPADGRQQAAGLSTQPINISRSPATFSWLPRIVHAPGNSKKIYLVWQEIIFSGASHGGEIFFARSEDGGLSFHAPVNVSHSIGGDGKGRINKDVWHNGSYDLALAPGGDIHIVWTEYDGMLWIAGSSDAGKSFSKPKQIAGSKEKPARGPSIAVGRDGAMYLAWTTGESDSADILIARSNDRGASFSAPRAVAASQTYSDAPKLAIDSKGVLHLAYAESAGDAFGNYHVRYTRSFDSARSFEAPRNISKPFPDELASAAFPSLAADAGDRIILSWELYPRSGEGPSGLGYAVSRDGGKTFGPPGTVPESTDPAGGTNGSHQGLLMDKLAVNGSGALAVANSSLKPGTQSRVWLICGQLAR